MNAKIMRTVLLLALTVLLLLPLVACSQSKAILSHDGITIDEKIYRYWYIERKAYYLSSFSDLSDDRVFWESDMPNTDMTYGEFIDDKIRTQIRFYLAGNVLFKQYDLKLSKDVKDRISEEINDGIQAFGGSRSQYDAYLESRYGIDSALLKDIKTLEQKFYAAYSYFYDSETGVDKATDAEIKAFYQENYARIKYYMVLKKYDYVYDKNGNRVTDSNGRYEMEELDAAGQAENKAHAEEVLQKIQSGENIDDYVKKYYSDVHKVYPNGYYVLHNDTYGAMFTPAVINAAFSIQVGESILCENEDAYFIVYRETLPENGYLGSDKGQFSEIASDAIEDKFMNRFGDVIDQFTVDQALVDSISVMTVNQK